jgi:copper chaperone CopZ
LTWIKANIGSLSWLGSRAPSRDEKNALPADREDPVAHVARREHHQQVLTHGTVRAVRISTKGGVGKRGQALLWRGAMETATLLISGINSAASLRSVQSALSVIRGVAGVWISPDDGKVVVQYDAHKVLPRQFRTAVRVVGCEIESLSVEMPDTPPSQELAKQ